MPNNEKPNCHKCVHRRAIPGNCHISCNNVKANISGDRHGRAMGWFTWPFNFDPVWLISCDGFSDKPEDNLKSEASDDPMFSLLTMLR